MWCSFHLKVVIVSFFFQEVCNVLYGKPGGLSCQVGIAKGHSTNRGGDHLHIGDPRGLVLYNTASTHHSHCRFDDHFWLHELQGHLVGIHRWQVPSQAGCYLLKALGWGHHVCWFQRLGWGWISFDQLYWNCSSGHWHQALLTSEFQWWCLCLISSKAGGACPTVVTSWEGCNTFSQLGNQFGEPSILACFSCSTQGGVESLRGPLVGVATSSDGTSVGAGGTSLETEVWLPKNPSSRATPPKMISSENEKYCSIVLCNSRMDPAKRHGWPGIGRLALTAQLCRAWA